MSDETTLLINTGETTSSKRYGVWIASVFVVGTICGSGVLAIPQALVNSGWAGVALLIVSGVIAAYNGTLLGDCWMLLRERYPEYEHTRVTDPYPTIGFRAGGKIGEYATRICIDITLFGGGTVYILLIGENIKNLISSFGGGDFYLCYLVMIIWCFLTPISWLGTPKDFWQAGIVATVTTSIGALLIAAGAAKDAPLHTDALPRNITPSSFFQAFGTILYAFGGGSCLPTIQVDMADPSRFPLAAAIGMAAILILYLPAGISGLVAFGDDMKDNVINALSPGPISYIINILITSHLVMAFIIISNPVTQEIEGFFRVPDRFTWKRVMVRSIYTLAIVFVALSIPHFSVILSLVGGSTIACTSFIFPPLFYFLLTRQSQPTDAEASKSLEQNGDVYDDEVVEYETNDWRQIRLRLFTKVFLMTIVAVGIAGGLSSTYFAVASLVNGESGFTVPCYVNVTVG